MKLTNKLCGAVLLGAIGLGVALPSTTHALVGTGDVEFTRDTSKDTDTGVFPPGGTDESTKITDDSIIVDTAIGDFGVAALTPLDFGQHAVATDTTSREYFAKVYSANEGATNGSAYPVEHFVKVRDDRSTLNHKYTLSAELTKQFTGTVEGTAVTLDGASINYSNLELVSTVDPALQPTAPVLGAAGSKAQTISFGGGSVPFYVNTEANKGRGDIDLAFGRQEKGTADTSVQLSVPTSTEIFNGKYNATITWTLAETL